MLKYSVHSGLFAILLVIQAIHKEEPMYAVLDKDTIKKEILPCLSTAKPGYETKSCLTEILNAIPYKLKTGCQWKHLPVEFLFPMPYWDMEPYSIISTNGVRPESGKTCGLHSLTGTIYVDEALYAERYSVEQTKAWIDSSRTLLNRFDTTVSSWESWNYLAFAVLLLKKIS